MSRLAKFIGGLFVTFVVLGLAFTVAMRTKCPPFQNALRKFNKAVVNPDQMQTAGQQGAYASVIRHVGRKSGTEYETPVQARSTGTGFVIPLPYGTTPDWYKNLVAAGSATLVNEGITYGVADPTLVDGSVAEPYILPDDLKAHRFFGVDQYLQLQKLVPAAEEDVAASV